MPQASCGRHRTQKACAGRLRWCMCGAHEVCLHVRQRLAVASMRATFECTLIERARTNEKADCLCRGHLAGGIELRRLVLVGCDGACVEHMRCACT